MPSEFIGHLYERECFLSEVSGVYLDTSEIENVGGHMLACS